MRFRILHDISVLVDVNHQTLRLPSRLFPVVRCKDSHVWSFPLYDHGRGTRPCDGRVVSWKLWVVEESPLLQTLLAEAVEVLDLPPRA